MQSPAELTTPLDVEAFRSEFPILNERVHDHPLVYLDNAATTQKPQSVIDSLGEYYSRYNANIHRGIHHLSEKATNAYENTRKRVAQFLNARNAHEILFTSGTTEGINLVAASYGRSNVGPGDEVLLTHMEHHSNIVPWQMLCEEKGATLRVLPVSEAGDLELDHLEDYLNEKTKILAVVMASNTLGSINPVKQLTEKAHEVGAVVVVDGAQATPHLPVDVQDLNCDFYAFSAHKMYGPTGTGALYGKEELLEQMPPYKGGGEMIAEVDFEGTTYNELPHKFEAGTPNIADTIGIAATIDFIEKWGKANIRAHEEQLLAYAAEQLSQIDKLRIIGTAREKVSVISFVVEGVHHQDLAIMLDTRGIAVRTGHHCTQPLMKRYNILGTTRASFAGYNTTEEVDKLVAGLQKAIRMLE